MNRAYVDAWNDGALYLRERAAVACEAKAKKQFGKGSEQRIADCMACAAAIRNIQITGTPEVKTRP